MTSQLLTFDVLGHPSAQGSKRGYYVPKLRRVVVVDDNKPAVKTWRSDVAEAAEQAMAKVDWDHQRLPVDVRAVYYLPRPKGHFGSGRNQHLLRPTAPHWPAGKPDGDKLDRATRDSLTLAGVWFDDSRVVRWFGEKRYADRNRPGAHIEIRLLTQDRHAYTHPQTDDDALWDLPPGAHVQDASVAGRLL